MAWWGKVLGGGFGYLLGGTLGALIGAVIGHQVDSGGTALEEDQDWSPGAQPRVQTAFFTATFSVMGHLAKADGRVTDDEIAHARMIMANMELTDAQKRVAMALFAEGKEARFDLHSCVTQLHREIGARKHLAQMFLELQIDSVMADGQVHPHEREILIRIAAILGFPRVSVDQLLAAAAGKAYFHNSDMPAAKTESRMQAACKVLGVEPGCDDEELKKTYRRLMNQHHPDKLVAQGLPEEMIKAATSRVQEIQEAYEYIKSSRHG